ncbi:hypothetical protein RFI_25724, partial [Reticulomyxa filosa]
MFACVVALEVLSQMDQQTKNVYLFVYLYIFIIVGCNKYEILFDYEHRRIVLLNINQGNETQKCKVESLQIGNSKKSVIEFDVDIQWNNDIYDIETTEIKWCHLILNKSWYFRMLTNSLRECLSNYCF